MRYDVSFCYTHFHVAYNNHDQSNQMNPGPDSDQLFETVSAFRILGVKQADGSTHLLEDCDLEKLLRIQSSSGSKILVKAGVQLVATRQTSSRILESVRHVLSTVVAVVLAVAIIHYAGKK